MRIFLLSSLTLCICFACVNKSNKDVDAPKMQSHSEINPDSIPFVCIIDTPNCSDAGCTGTYKGVEFIDPAYIEHFGLNGTDVAHQYSNKMCEYVGKHLKYLYSKGHYSKVDFKHIKLQTLGMDQGKNYVEYRVEIPFVSVPKEQAMTGFDHCGGWGHKPEIQKRKFDLINSTQQIVKNKKLWVSRLFKTEEGLEEYWIQWQHSDYQ